MRHVQHWELAPVRRAPVSDHEKWHKLFGDDCRRGEGCPLRRPQGKEQAA